MRAETTDGLGGPTRRRGNGKGVRDRVVELLRVRAGDLKEHPRNWRRHPESQRAADGVSLCAIRFAHASHLAVLPYLRLLLPTLSLSSAVA